MNRRTFVNLGRSKFKFSSAHEKYGASESGLTWHYGITKLYFLTVEVELSLSIFVSLCKNPRFFTRFFFLLHGLMQNILSFDNKGSFIVPQLSLFLSA